MGASIGAQKNPTSDYAKSCHAMCRIIIERTFSAIQNFDFLYRFTDNYKTELKSCEILHRQTDLVVDAKKKRIEESDQIGTSTNEDDFGLNKKRQAFLDMLINLTDDDGKPLFNDEELREEVATFLFAVSLNSMNLVVVQRSKFFFFNWWLLHYTH